MIAAWTSATASRPSSCPATIVRSGVGVETVDLEAARAAGMWVARVADYGTEAVALHAFTLVLAGIRSLLQGMGY